MSASTVTPELRALLRRVKPGRCVDTLPDRASLWAGVRPYCASSWHSWEQQQRSRENRVTRNSVPHLRQVGVT